jgi:hypothetical protein
MSGDYWDDGHHHGDGYHGDHRLHESYAEWHWQPYGWTWGYDHFDPIHSNTSHLIGDPSDLSVWHEQVRPDDCAVVSQQFILNEMGVNCTEQDCVAVANSFYDITHGTTPDQVGLVLNHYGVPTESHVGNNLDYIREQLALGNKVIVGVDADVLDLNKNAAPGVPGHHGNHAVQVVAIDDSDPAHPKIILNDPGVPSGRGVIIPSDKFYQAWGTTGNFIMHTLGTAAIAQAAPAVYAPRMMGHDNADGTYHYDSDGSNRDPVSGKVASYGAADHERSGYARNG